MALLITKNETILGDINISQMYVRLTISYGPNGEELTIQAIPYSSKNSYELNEYSNQFQVPGITGAPYIINYDRAADGNDILTYVHNEIKTLLSTDIIREVSVLDPLTGSEMSDPSTGEIITESIIVVPKFAMDSSILIDI
jgi:hypothetical protein